MAILYNHEIEDTSEHCGISIEDSEAVKQVSNSITLENGYFVVGIPWKRSKSDLPNNVSVALRRLKQLKKRFVLGPRLLYEIQEFDSETLGLRVCYHSARWPHIFRQQIESATSPSYQC